jgi:GT2 family glycosyltransferase
VTALVVTWNAAADVLPCLRSVYASTFANVEVLVIDNASTDETAALVERSYPQARLVRNATNVGHTQAVNQGLREVRSDLVLVLDADTELAPDAIGAMAGFLHERADAGMVAPRTYNDDGTIQESARNFPSAINGLFGRQSVLTRVFPNNRFSARYLQRDRLDTDAPFPVDSVASSCMLLRHSLVTRHGPWDEGYAGYFVDTDWCFRLRRQGVGIYCVPAARVVHHEQNHRGRKRGIRRIVMFHRGAFRFYRRNLTRGWFDPRTLLAGIALSLRAAMLVVCDACKAADAAPRRPAKRVAGGVAPVRGDVK